jgi:hypothetical protein
MRRFLFLVAAIVTGLALTVPATGANGGEKAGEKGWVQLFNGKDLKGWKVHPDEPGMWTVEKGVLIGRGDKRSHIFSERGDYKDFHYRVEAKISDKGNSGQYFRTKYMAGYPTGYEAQINSTFPDPQKTGSLYNFAKITEQLVPADTWFTQEVIARGNHIIIKVNGKEVVHFKDEKNTHVQGHFAFQQHSPVKGGPASEVQIRKVEVKEFSAPK